MRQEIELTVNGRTYELSAEPRKTLLAALRDQLQLTGTKEGCGEGECGSCTVLLDGARVLSCLTLAVQAEGRRVTTIEGLDENGNHPVQEAWRNLRVPQCGYCQSGQIMQAASLLKDTPNPSDDDIDAVMTGNLCRCMTYTRIRQAVRDAATAMGGSDNG